MRAAFSVLAPVQSISTTICSGPELGAALPAAGTGVGAAAAAAAAAVLGAAVGCAAADGLPLLAPPLPLLLLGLLPLLRWPSPCASAGCEMTNCSGGEGPLPLPLPLPSAAGWAGASCRRDDTPCKQGVAGEGCL